MLTMVTMARTSTLWCQSDYSAVHTVTMMTLQHHVAILAQQQLTMTLLTLSRTSPLISTVFCSKYIY